MRARRQRLRDRLIVAFLAPTLVLAVGFGVYTYVAARDALEQTTAERLIVVALATAAPMSTSRDAERIRDLAPDKQRVIRNLRRKLSVLQAATRVRRLFVVGLDGTSKVDTRDGVVVGQRLGDIELDRHELKAVARGATAASHLFTGADGARYLHGYAPVRTPDGTVVAAVGAEGSAGYFDILDRLAWTLGTTGLALMALIVVVALVVSRRITGPLARLADAAERIGEGALAAPVPVEGQDEVGLLGHRLDTMRTALLDRDEELQLMLAGIAHEVRNPLGGIQLFAGLLREELSDGEARDHVRRIEAESAHLERVVEDFLTYARRHPLELVEVALSDFVEEALVSARERAAANAVEVSVSCEGRARLDPERMRRALLNMLDNALNAMPRGGCLRVEANRAADTAFIEVVDDGEGVAEESVAHVFRPFYTTREKGTGLGLALCRKTAVAHGGDVRLESHPGKGTRVRIEWPT